jgi:uncharacterized Tic20 family protein
MRLERHDERTAACLAHLAGIIPGWGALFMGWALWRYRESGRGVIWHARQALVFHFMMLALMAVPLLIYAAGRVLSVLRPELGGLLVAVGQWSGLLLYVVNASFVLVAAERVIDGAAFEYPLHRRVMDYLDIK